MRSLPSTQPKTLPPMNTQVVTRPEFFNLPGRGPDPVCSMSRSWWLLQEKMGLIKLHRMYPDGDKTRRASRVLVPTADAIALVRKLAA